MWKITKMLSLCFWKILKGTALKKDLNSYQLSVTSEQKQVQFQVIRLFYSVRFITNNLSLAISLL